MLAEMSRQILNTHAKLEKFVDMRMFDIEARMEKGIFQGVVFPLPLPLRHEAREAPQGLLIEAHRLSHFACRGLAAIGNHVGGHRSAKLPIALVDVLDRLLALIPGGQVEIDIGPFTSAL